MIAAGALLRVLLLAQMGPGSSHGQLQGRFVDPEAAAIRAGIRVLSSDAKVVARLQAKEDGTFHTEPLPPGTYSLTALSPGFRRSDRHDITVEAGRTKDLGDTTLDLAGCDAPGTHCSFYGEVPYDVMRIAARGNITLGLSCAVDLDRKGKAVCGHDGREIVMANADISLARQDGALYLVAATGAAISAMYASNTDCSGVKFGEERIAVAGLGRGVDFCVRTKGGTIAHVFFTEDVSRESSSVSLWYVTRKAR